MAALGGCLPAWSPGPPLRGIEGLGTLTLLSHNPGMAFLSLIIMSAWLLVCAAWAMWPAAFAAVLGGGVPKRRSSVRLAVAIDAAITAVFVLSVGTQLNKLVLVLAALHNWTEWVFLGNVYLGFLGAFEEFGYGAQGMTSWNRALAVLILVQMLGIMLIDDVGHSFIFEEVLGLWTDLQLVVVSVYCWCTTRGIPGVGPAMAKFGTAAAFHFALIITLQLEFNMVLPDWPAGQAFAMIFSTLNFALYTMFALALDGWLCEQEDAGKPPPVAGWAALTHERHEDPEKPPQMQASEGGSAIVPGRLPGLPPWSSCTAVTFILGIFCLSASLVVLPIVLGVYCETAPSVA
mmetsp:Transcript_38242/g.101108  ORF Transcript_38242/g.101108 Transcript_38242/m.101108 type:complete len:347 (-) Transcript_38242:139-1179(-)